MEVLDPLGIVAPPTQKAGTVGGSGNLTGGGGIGNGVGRVVGDGGCLGRFWQQQKALIIEDTLMYLQSSARLQNSLTSKSAVDLEGLSWSRRLDIDGKLRVNEDDSDLQSQNLYLVYHMISGAR